jgi:hypothetical protein
VGPGALVVPALGGGELAVGALGVGELGVADLGVGNGRGTAPVDAQAPARVAARIATARRIGVRPQSDWGQIGS